MTYQLEKQVADRLKAFFENYDFIDKVVIFGSRAKHNANPKSDIDLCIYSLEMSDVQFSKLKLSLDELPILYAIDIVHFEKSNEALRENIERDGKLLFAKYVKITNVCDFQGGSQPPKNEWSDTQLDNYVRMLQIRDFTQGKTKYIQYVKNTKTLKKCGVDDILIGRYGASIGKILTGLEGAYNVALMKITPNENLSREYLFQFLNSSKFQNKISNFSGRAAQAGFNKNDLEDILVYLPSLTKQKEIAQTLDKASELIELRKATIEKLDELSKSIFIDMFGDPVENPMKWEIKFLEDVVQKDCPLSYGIVQPGEEFLNGVLVVRPVDLNNSNICVTNMKRVDPLISNKFKKTLLHGDEILLSVRGTTGVLGYANEKLKNANVTRGIVPIRFDSNYKKYFIFYLLLTEQMQRVIQEKTYGATLQQINLSEVRKLKCINPPIELQNKFAQTIEKLEAQKFLYEAELTKLQENFDALMAQSFEG